MKNPDTFEQATQEIATEIANLVIGKQKDYGQHNILDFGEEGVLIRANDKIARLKNLRGKEGVTEPRLDSWKDLAGYAVVALLLDRGWFTLPMKGEK